MKRRDILFFIGGYFIAMFTCAFAWVSTTCRVVRVRKLLPVKDSVDTQGWTGTDPVGPLPTDQDQLEQLVRSRIQGRLPKSTNFGFLAIVAVGTMIVRLVQVCQAAQMLRLQAKCAAKPNGKNARSFKARIHAQLAADLPEVSDAEIQEHVSATFQEFIEMSPEELQRFKEAANAANRQPTESATLYQFAKDLQTIQEEP